MCVSERCPFGRHLSWCNQIINSYTQMENRYGKCSLSLSSFVLFISIRVRYPFFRNCYSHETVLYYHWTKALSKSKKPAGCCERKQLLLFIFRFTDCLCFGDLSNYLLGILHPFGTAHPFASCFRLHLI